MADNYLEKKMEEHRHGIRPVFRRSPSGNKPHTFCMPCNIKSAFIIGDEQLDDILLACASTLRETSCRVAFCCTDRMFGSSTAQKYGLQYYPIPTTAQRNIDNAIETAGVMIGNIDVIVSKRPNGISVDILGNKSNIDIDKCCNIKDVANAIVYLTLPQSIGLGLIGNFNLNSEGILSIVKN